MFGKMIQHFELDSRQTVKLDTLLNTEVKLCIILDL